MQYHLDCHNKPVRLARRDFIAPMLYVFVGLGALLYIWALISMTCRWRKMAAAALNKRRLIRKVHRVVEADERYAVVVKPPAGTVCGCCAGFAVLGFPVLTVCTTSCSSRVQGHCGAIAFHIRNFWPSTKL